MRENCKFKKYNAVMKYSSSTDGAVSITLSGTEATWFDPFVRFLLRIFLQHQQLQHRLTAAAAARHAGKHRVGRVQYHTYGGK